MLRFEVFWAGITSYYMVNIITDLPDSPLDKVYWILRCIRDVDGSRRGDYFQINEDGSWSGQARGRRFRITQKEDPETVGQAGVAWTNTHQWVWANVQAENQ